MTNERELAIENGSDYSDVQKKGREVGKEAQAAADRDEQSGLGRAVDPNGRRRRQ